MSEVPVLSIVIPTHKRPDLLRRAVSSALKTTNFAIEIVVVSDRDVCAEESLASLKSDPRLRYLNNEGPGGAADTRNKGASFALGSILLFLDDDDELVPEYCEKVFVSSKIATWGFSGTKLRVGVNSEPIQSSRGSWHRGFPNPSVPFRRKLGALSAGFWIRRDLFLRLGGLCTDQTLDEDTDLCCRLLASGHQPWFEPGTSVIVDRDISISRLTLDTSAELRAECYLRTFLRNGILLATERGGSSYLAFRAMRMIVRSRRLDLLSVLYANVPSKRLRFALRAKHILYSLRRHAGASEVADR